MTTRLETQNEDDVRVHVYGLTIGEIKDILKHVPQDARYVQWLQQAVARDEDLGYWPNELLTAFIMGDAAEAFDRYNVDSGDSEVHRVEVAKMLARADAYDMGDVLCYGDWDLALAITVRDHGEEEEGEEE